MMQRFIQILFLGSLSLMLLFLAPVLVSSADDVIATDAATSQPLIAEYLFEDNLNDSLNGHNATFLMNGEMGSAEFTPFGTSTGLSMSPTQGISLPDTLSAAIDTSKGFEINMTFQIPDLGIGTANKYLFSTMPVAGYNEPGMLIGINHDEFSTDDDYSVTFSYSDGGFNNDVPGHPGHFATPIGLFTISDRVSLKLVVDFETMTWSTLLNAQFTSGQLDPYFDYDIIKATLTDNEWHFGWAPEQELDMAFDPTAFTSSAIMDNLTISSPRNNGDPALLQAALIALTNHCNGSATLPEAARSTHLTDIFINYVGSYAAAETEIAQFIQAYEDNYPPLFENREQVPFQTLPPESQALLFVQQAMFDEQFVDGNMENMQGAAYEFASVFPGAVENSALVQSNKVVPINGTYNRVEGARLAADLDDATRPTGTYAAPGALITVDIPAALADKGLKVMVGAHTADHSGLFQTNRFVRISKTIPLDSVQTTIVNPFGGGIYIRVPEGSTLGSVDVTISGAVNSAYFSTRAAVPGDLTAWQTALSSASVPWIDLESDKYMVTLPLAHVSELGLTDPTSLMATWDEMMDGFRYVGGRPAERARAEYFLIDSRLPDDAFGTGYPQVIGSENAPYAPFDAGNLEYYPTHVLMPQFYISEYNTTLHERGHGALHPTLIDEVESIIHVNATYIYNQQFGTTLDDAFKYSSQEFLSMDQATMDWMIAQNFRTNMDMGCDPTMEDYLCAELRYQHRGHAKYAEMAELFGWESVHNMNKVFYDAWSVTVNAEDVVTKDDMLRAASESNGVNMAPLFHFWGHAPSAALQAELAALPSSPEIYAQLRAYFDLVPESKSELQPFYDVLIEWKDVVHADRINAANDNYETESYAQQMQDQICLLLSSYYPDSPAAECSDAPTALTQSGNETTPIFSAGRIMLLLIALFTITLVTVSSRLRSK